VDKAHPNAVTLTGPGMSFRAMAIVGLKIRTRSVLVFDRTRMPINFQPFTSELSMVTISAVMPPSSDLMSPTFSRLLLRRSSCTAR